MENLNNQPVETGSFSLPQETYHITKLIKMGDSELPDCRYLIEHNAAPGDQFYVSEARWYDIFGCIHDSAGSLPLTITQTEPIEIREYNPARPHTFTYQQVFGNITVPSRYEILRPVEHEAYKFRAGMLVKISPSNLVGIIISRKFDEATNLISYRVGVAADLLVTAALGNTILNTTPKSNYRFTKMLETEVHTLAVIEIGQSFLTQIPSTL